MKTLLVALLQTLSATASPPPPTTEKTVVVTGKRLSTTESELAACIARGCPPKDEIDAALAHAENQFVAGDYAASRRTLLEARSRNARFAKGLPVDVADLLRANGRLAALNGLRDSARINAIDTWGVLKDGLPANDRRVLMQRLLVADAFFKDRRLEAARDIYADVARRGRVSDQPEVEGHALFRIAIIDVAVSMIDPGYRGRADRSIRVIEQKRSAAFAPFRAAVKDLRLELATRGRALGGADAGNKAAVGRVDGAVLVYAPPVDIEYVRPPASTNVVLQGDSTPQWADITFRITTDGGIADVETLRTSEHAYGGWLAAAEASIRKRRYRPLAASIGPDGLQRTERFSFLYDVARVKGSHIRGRANNPRVEITDLTIDPRES